MSYQVIETQEFSEPREEWAVVATFETEAEAQHFAVRHYETSISTRSNFSTEAELWCGCEGCREGFRVTDYKSLVVEVVEVK